LTSDFGYKMYCIKNGDEHLTYQEVMCFPTFDGMTLIEPESGNQYAIKVPAQ